MPGRCSKYLKRSNEQFPALSPDGQYLFFVNNRISNKFQSRDDLTPEALKEMENSPQNGSSDIYRVDVKIIKEIRLKTKIGDIS